MATAKERAREAACDKPMTEHYVDDAYIKCVKHRAADAASEVWEQVLTRIAQACEEESQTETQKLANILQIIDYETL